VDVSDASGRPDPVRDYEVIRAELKNFGAGLEDKPEIVAATKIDAVNSQKLAALKRYCKRHKLELHAISAVAGAGIEELTRTVASRIVKLREAEAAPAGTSTPGTG
jgi:GTP-binding protein